MRGSRSRGCHERPAFRVIRPPELVGRAEKREPALQHEPDAAAEQQALPHVVGHEDHAFPEPPLERRELALQLHPGDRVERTEGLVQPIDELERGSLPGPAPAQQDERLSRAHGERHVPHEGPALSPLPLSPSRQVVAQTLDLERLRHAGETSTMRNRWSSLRPCQRAASPASERIRRKVSAAYLYE